MPASDIYYVRNQITRSMIVLMGSVDFKSITITMLVKHAQVGRASFYRHFTDTRDVVRQHLHQLTGQWRSVYDEIPENQRMALLLNHFYANKDFYLALYHAHLSEMLRDCMQEAWKLSEQSDNKIAYLIAWYSGAAFGWIDEWIKRGMNETPKEMCTFLEVLISPKQ